jgi:hypothetical protein
MDGKSGSSDDDIFDEFDDEESVKPLDETMNGKHSDSDEDEEMDYSD